MRDLKPGDRVQLEDGKRATVTQSRDCPQRTFDRRGLPTGTAPGWMIVFRVEEGPLRGQTFHAIHPPETKVR